MKYNEFKYLITGFPRSGTAWFSQLLSAKDNHICLHEPETSEAATEEAFHTYETVGCSSSFPVVFTDIEKIKIPVVVIRRDFDKCLHGFLNALVKSNKGSLVSATKKELADTEDSLDSFIKKTPCRIYEFNDVFYSDDSRKTEIVNELWWHLFHSLPSSKEQLKINALFKLNIQIQNVS